MACCKSFLELLGRISLGVIFLLSGVGKFMDAEGTAAYMAAKGMSMVPFFLYAAAIIEIVGGVLVIIGYRARWGAALLLLFLIPTTLIFHDFWNYGDQENKMQMINFMKNLAIFGGLLLVAAHGAGKYSLDNCCEGKSCCR